MSARPRLLLPTLLAAGAVVLAVVVIVLVSGGSSSTNDSVANAPAAGDQAFDGAALPEPRQVPDFTLKDAEGHEVSLSSLRGQVVVLAFVYTTCGAPCELLGQQIRGAIDELGHRPAVLMISADPEHDTSTGMRRYLDSVSLTGRALYLSGSKAQLEPLWKTYRVRPASAGRRLFAEYTSVVLIDPQGRERVIYNLEQLSPESLSHDIGKLQAG